MPLSTLDQRRHSSASAAKTVRTVCAAVSVARKASAACTIGAVETPLARMGNSPGRHPGGAAHADERLRQRRQLLLGEGLLSGQHRRR